MHTSSAVYRMAAEVLRNNTWCQTVDALDAHGYGVDPTDADACEFCLAGALIYAAGSQEAAEPYFREIMAHLAETESEDFADVVFNPHDPYDVVSTWNDMDWRSKEDVVACLESQETRLARMERDRRIGT